MSIAPIITFKAGQCELDTSSRPYKVKPQPDPGYIYLYSEDDLIHFCWRKRDAPLSDPELDLVMVPTDGSFVPYEYKTTPQPTAKTNGRIFALKFASSSQRHVFWLQSKPQSNNGDPAWISPRDRKIGEIVHQLLQGEEVNVARELASVRNTDNNADDDDETMEDAEGEGATREHRPSGSGGAGPGATGGDVREEGEEAREGGADGARARSGQASYSNTDASEAVRNLLNSLGGSGGGAANPMSGDKAYPNLSQLLPTSVTIPMVDSIASSSSDRLDSLLNFLPASIIVLSGNNPSDYDGKNEPSAEAVARAKESLSLEDKKSLVKKILRSPQFHQGLVAISKALYDGGLPGISDALGIEVENNGYMKNMPMPVGGGQALEAFVDGMKNTIQKQKRQG